MSWSVYPQRFERIRFGVRPGSNVGLIAMEPESDSLNSVRFLNPIMKNWDFLHLLFRVAVKIKCVNIPEVWWV